MKRKTKAGMPNSKSNHRPMTDETTENGDGEFDEQIHHERTDRGYSIKVQLKRGTATRDEDRIEAKVKEPTREEAVEGMDALKGDLRELAGFARNVQPELVAPESDEDGDGE